MPRDPSMHRLSLDDMEKLFQEITGSPMTDAEREMMHASYEAQLQVGKGADGVVRRGPPVDWAHEGQERRSPSADGTPPGYTCSICRDVGFVRRDVPLGHPDFGKAHRCRCQVQDPAARQADYQHRLALSGLPVGLRRCTLDAFRPVAGAAAGLTAAREFLATLEHGGDPLWLAVSGGLGCGKTHLLAGITQAALLRQPVVWLSLPQWLSDCRVNDFEHEHALTITAQQTPVLVLDEFGSQRATDWTLAKVEQLVDYRYARRLPTVLAITATPEELATWSPRIASRLGDHSLVRAVVLTGGDYRARLTRTKA